MEKVGTRRGILSTLSSIFDLLGLVSQFILNGKKYFTSYADRTLTGMISLAKTWEYSKASIQKSSGMKIPSCLKKMSWAEITYTSLNYFSDGVIMEHSVIGESNFPSIF